MPDRGSFAIALILLALTFLSATTARASLADLVTDDVGLVVEVDDLAGHVERFQKQELGQRLATSPLAAEFLATHGKNLRSAIGKLEHHLGVPASEAWAKLLAKEGLLAIWPAREPAKPPPTLLLVRAGDAKLLQRVAERFLEGHRAAGRLLEPATCKVAGREVRVDTIRIDKDRTLSVGVDGDLAVLGTDRAEVIRALERQALPEDQSLAKMPAWVAAHERLQPGSVARLFVNPRPWDEAMSKPDGAANERQAAVREAVGGVWRASAYLVAGLYVGAELKGELHVGWGLSNVPEPWRTLVGAIQGESALVRRMPRDTLVGVVGRVDGRAVVDAIVAYQRERSARQTTVPQVVALTLARGLGPDAALFVRAPSNSGEVTDTDDSQAWPLPWTAALSTQALEAGAAQQPVLSQWLVPLVRQVLATLDQVGPASADLERLPIVESRDHDGRSVTRLAERNGPRAVWITQEGSLSWIGTRKASSGKAATESEVGDSLATRLTSPGWLVFADLAGARRLVSDRSSIVESIVAHDHVGEAEAQARRDKLLDVLRLADRLVVEAAVDGQGLSAAWRLTAEGPKP